jgi:hypothetical protein
MAIFTTKGYSKNGIISFLGIIVKVDLIGVRLNWMILGWTC